MTQNPKLSLPNVTLVLIDNIVHELSQKALEDTLNLINPHDIAIWTDDPFKMDKISKLHSTRYYPFGGKTIEAYNEILWWEVPKHITTSHVLVLQWDGWVINKNFWTDEFLSYDYIGAIWPWHETFRIGNGGFSLRSVRLMQYLSRWIKEGYIHLGPLEDDSLCRIHRPELESFGFKWPDEFIANNFSREHNWKPQMINASQLNPELYPPGTPGILTTTKSFGFHDCRNWFRILTPLQLFERAALCEKNPYITKKPAYQELINSVRKPIFNHSFWTGWSS
jgi:hypothetical protein